MMDSMPPDPMMGYDTQVMYDVMRTQQALSQTLAQFQLNFAEEVERFEYLLRGVIKDKDTGELLQIHEPILNDRGRTHIMKKVRTWLTKAIAQSNYTEHQVNNWCKVYWAELVADAYSFGDLWDLRQDEYSSFVHDCVFSLHGMLNAAKDGGLREVVGKISKVLETNTINAPEKARRAIL